MDFAPIFDGEKSMDEEAALLTDLRDAGKFLGIGRIIFEVETVHESWRR